MTFHKRIPTYYTNFHNLQKKTVIINYGFGSVNKGGNHIEVRNICVSTNTISRSIGCFTFSE
jgi:hypothetical protein